MYPVVPPHVPSVLTLSPVEVGEALEDPAEVAAVVVVLGAGVETTVETEALEVPAVVTAVVVVGEVATVEVTELEDPAEVADVAGVLEVAEVATVAALELETLQVPKLDWQSVPQ